MANNTGNWVWTDEGLSVAPVVGARRVRRGVAAAVESQPMTENALLLLVALLPLLLAAIALVSS